jgi:hypothetical protein
LDCAVVLGGDKPLALPLILDLEKKGYIVVASVSTSHAVDELESKTHGYVRGLVLDPVDVSMVLLLFPEFNSHVLLDSLLLFPSFSVLLPLRFHVAFQSIQVETLTLRLRSNHTSTL